MENGAKKNGTRRLPQTVIVLGLVSFFNDLASDMVIPLIPLLLAGLSQSGPLALGFIEGIADAIASFLKLGCGRYSDKIGGRRKALTLFGYALSNLARPLLGFAGGWLSVLFLRGADRVGKGIRSAPRDALIVDTTPPLMRGYAFGLQRALDNAGAVAGSLIAAAILAWSALEISSVILWSTVPGAIAVLLLALGVREKPVISVAAPPLPPLRWTALPPVIRRYLGLIILFTFARVSETFIVLRGHELGMSVVQLLLLWAMLNCAKAASSAAGGRLSDRLGHGYILVISWSAYAIGFILFGLVEYSAALWYAALFYGIFTGLGEGAERALIGDFSVQNERGTAFGWYYLMAGLAAIPAGLLFGAIWNYQQAHAAFWYASILASLSVVMLLFVVLPKLQKQAANQAD